MNENELKSSVTVFVNETMSYIFCGSLVPYVQYIHVVYLSLCM